ncbi:hypothetical protein [Streptomyces showdoensis]|uniref:Uncharacterized protein n=1 Tax=Streptomyces showdoensis TaxID=68268 RepID=A0A2P2GVF3_STREW|nr:hypothetical protein [Streptomyces showdoensis]KKZ74859.1 hypothetical protein VO63_05260 [Streptomyces showdoensis]
MPFFRTRKSQPATSQPSHPDDNRRLKSTGERVTILGRTSDGAVRVALTDRSYYCDTIVSPDDIAPA